MARVGVLARFIWLLLALLALGSTSYATAGKPDIQTLHVDRVEFNLNVSEFCRFPILEHAVGTVRVLTFPDGRMVVEENEQSTFSSPFGGSEVTLDHSLKTVNLSASRLLAGGGRTVTLTSTFTGLNYRIPGPGGAFVSAGKGIATTTYTYDADGQLIDVEVEEVSTPGLKHLTAVICQAVAGVPLGRASISGTITAEATGAPLKDVCVGAFDADSGRFTAFTMSAADGTYTMRFLVPGRYKVLFVDCTTGAYLGEWYNDKDTFEVADAVTVTGGSSTRAVDAALTLGGRVSGTVTAEATGTPLENVEVDLVNASNPDDSIAAVTGADGTYRFEGLPAGPFKLLFVDVDLPLTYAPEWYDDKTDFNTADQVQVSVGVETPGIDAALAVGGSISGTVTDPAGMELFPCASATNVTSGFPGVSSLGSPGAYRITGLPAGDYKVHFGSCSFLGNYVAEWYDDKPDFDSADLVTVALGVDTPGIDAVLAIGGSISGTVTAAASGEPLSDVAVCAFSGEFGNCADTRLDGTYTIDALATGEYVVYFIDFSETGYAFEAYNDKPDIDSADLVPVTAGVDTPGIDAALSK